MSLRPDKKPARQLMSMLWAEREGFSGYGKIFTSTHTLITRGFVEELGSDMVAVRLTASGRAEAERLMATPEGQTYMVEAAEEA